MVTLVRGCPVEACPLPEPLVEAVPRLGFSQGCVQRVQARRELQREVRDACGALNWLAGAEGACAVPSVQERHLSVHKDVETLCRYYSSATFPVPSEAARSLLGHKASYGQARAKLRPFVKDHVSLPAAACNCLLIAEEREGNVSI